VRQWLQNPVLKVVGICSFTWVFFIGYFHLLRNPSGPPLPMPLTPLDHWIGYRPQAIWAYVSLWVYVGVAPALLPSLRALVLYGAWAAALCAAGLACFWLWPTAVPASFVPADHGVDPMLMLLRGVDAAGNACPSLHVATAVFAAAWLARLLAAFGAPAWPHALNGLWLALIVWSTVALRQHVVLDVVAGVLLGLAFALPSLRWGPAPLMATPDAGRRL
jgi:hypothetical protein